MLPASAPPTWYYCLLCGERNSDATLVCRRCSMVRGALFGTDIPPAGWAAARIYREPLASIDETHEYARFVVQIRTNTDAHWAYHSEVFVGEKWDSWYPVPPPIPTALERRIEQAVVNQLHTDGWLDTLAGNGEPTNSLFWRRTGS